MRRRAVLFGGIAIAGGWPVRAKASEAHLPPVTDLEVLAADIARLRIPLLVLFSTPGCPYCLEVRRNYLAPRLAEGPQAGVIVREVDVTGTAVIRGLRGTALSAAEFAARHAVRAVPAVVLLNARMERLVEPLVGLDRSGFYEASLQTAIDAARQRLRDRG
jgi:hypothetical protein